MYRERVKSRRSLSAIELFSGAGGLSLAASRAGFDLKLALERDSLACATARMNFSGGNEERDHVVEVDVSDMRADELVCDLDLLLGGPPCQPFSRGGKGLGKRDRRDMLPVFTDFVRSIRPKAFLIENVAGLAQARFTGYFASVLGSLAYCSRKLPPPCEVSEGTVRPIFGRAVPDYHVSFKVFNAADFGVPQNRMRLFIVGIRADQQWQWSWPEQTHSKLELLKDQYITRDYFHRYDLRPVAYEGNKDQLREACVKAGSSPMLPHRTLRDALQGLPDPTTSTGGFSHHEFVPGARLYPHHTGSLLDAPSKAVKAGVHGCPGGENIVRLTNRRFRYLTVRELARVQDFPDDFEFCGTRNQCIRQIGNAVPVGLGEAMLREINAGLMSVKKSLPAAHYGR